MAQIVGRYKIRPTKSGRVIRTGRKLGSNPRNRQERKERPLRDRRRIRLTR